MEDLTSVALAAGTGDERAVERFVRASQADVWRFCAHLVDPADADDLTQDTYARALRALPSFRGESSARTWLLSIARRTCADHLRKVQRQRRLRDRMERRAEPAVLADPTGAVDALGLIDGLGEDQRLAVVLTQVLGLSYDEAAGVCDVPIGTIRSRVARARQAMVEQLDDQATGS